MSHSIICGRELTSNITHTLACNSSSELKVSDSTAEATLTNIEISAGNIEADLEAIDTTLTDQSQKTRLVGTASADGTGTVNHAKVDSTGSLVVQNPSFGHLSTIAGDTTSLDNKITSGEDEIAAGTGCQQVLIMGKDAFVPFNLEPIRMSSDKILVESQISQVATGITNTLPVKAKQFRVNGSEVAYVSGVSINSGASHTGDAIALDPNTHLICVEHSFGSADVMYEVETSIDGTTFHPSGSAYNVGGGGGPGAVAASATGLNIISGLPVGFPPHIRFKITNNDASSQTATISYVIQSE